MNVPHQNDQNFWAPRSQQPSWICLLAGKTPRMKMLGISFTHWEKREILEEELQTLLQQQEERVITVCFWAQEQQFAFFKPFLQWWTSPSSADIFSMSSRTARKKSKIKYIERRRKSYILLSSSVSFNGDHHHHQHTHSMSSRTWKEPNRRYIARRRKSYILLSSGPSFNGEENHLHKSMSERSATPPTQKPNIVRKWKCERHGLIHQHLTPHCSKNLLYPRAASREIAQG